MPVQRQTHQSQAQSQRKKKPYDRPPSRPADPPPDANGGGGIMRSSSFLGGLARLVSAPLKWFGGAEGEGRDGGEEEEEDAMAVEEEMGGRDTIVGSASRRGTVRDTQSKGKRRQSDPHLADRDSKRARREHVPPRDTLPFPLGPAGSSTARNFADIPDFETSLHRKHHPQHQHQQQHQYPPRNRYEDEDDEVQEMLPPPRPQDRYDPRYQHQQQHQQQAPMQREVSMGMSGMYAPPAADVRAGYGSPIRPSPTPFVRSTPVPQRYGTPTPTPTQHRFAGTPSRQTSFAQPSKPLARTASVMSDRMSIDGEGPSARKRMRQMVWDPNVGLTDAADLAASQQAQSRLTETTEASRASRVLSALETIKTPMSHGRAPVLPISRIKVPQPTEEAVRVHMGSPYARVVPKEMKEGAGRGGKERIGGGVGGVSPMNGVGSGIGSAGGSGNAMGMSERKGKKVAQLQAKRTPNRVTVEDVDKDEDEAMEEEAEEDSSKKGFSFGPSAQSTAAPKAQAQASTSAPAPGQGQERPPIAKLPVPIIAKPTPAPAPTPPSTAPTPIPTPTPIAGPSSTAPPSPLPPKPPIDDSGFHVVDSYAPTGSRSSLRVGATKVNRTHAPSAGAKSRATAAASTGTTAPARRTGGFGLPDSDDEDEPVPAPPPASETAEEKAARERRVAIERESFLPPEQRTLTKDLDAEKEVPKPVVFEKQDFFGESLKRMAEKTSNTSPLPPPNWGASIPAASFAPAPTAAPATPQPQSIFFQADVSGPKPTISFGGKPVDAPSSANTSFGGNANSAAVTAGFSFGAKPSAPPPAPKADDGPNPFSALIDPSLKAKIAAESSATGASSSAPAPSALAFSAFGGSGSGGPAAFSSFGASGSGSSAFGVPNPAASPFGAAQMNVSQLAPPASQEGKKQEEGRERSPLTPTPYALADIAEKEKEQAAAAAKASPFAGLPLLQPRPKTDPVAFPGLPPDPLKSSGSTEPPKFAAFGQEAQRNNASVLASLYGKPGDPAASTFTAAPGTQSQKPSLGTPSTFAGLAQTPVATTTPTSVPFGTPASSTPFSMGNYAFGGKPKSAEEPSTSKPFTETNPDTAGKPPVSFGGFGGSFGTPAFGGANPSQAPLGAATTTSAFGGPSTTSGNAPKAAYSSFTGFGAPPASKDAPSTPTAQEPKPLDGKPPSVVDFGASGSKPPSLFDRLAPSTSAANASPFGAPPTPSSANPPLAASLPAAPAGTSEKPITPPARDPSPEKMETSPVREQKDPLAAQPPSNAFTAGFGVPNPANASIFGGGTSSPFGTPGTSSPFGAPSNAFGGVSASQINTSGAGAFGTGSTFANPGNQAQPAPSMPAATNGFVSAVNAQQQAGAPYSFTFAGGAGGPNPFARTNSGTPATGFGGFGGAPAGAVVPSPQSTPTFPGQAVPGVTSPASVAAPPPFATQNSFGSDARPASAGGTAYGFGLPSPAVAQPPTPTFVFGAPSTPGGTPIQSSPFSGVPSLPTTTPAVPPSGTPVFHMGAVEETPRKTRNMPRRKK